MYQWQAFTFPGENVQIIKKEELVRKNSYGFIYWLETREFEDKELVEWLKP
jgi:hypothetical protein